MRIFDSKDFGVAINKRRKELGLTQISITDHNILEASIKASKISNIDFIFPNIVVDGDKWQVIYSD